MCEGVRWIGDMIEGPGGRRREGKGGRVSVIRVGVVGLGGLGEEAQKAI